MSIADDTPVRPLLSPRFDRFITGSRVTCALQLKGGASQCEQNTKSVRNVRAEGLKPEGLMGEGMREQCSTPTKRRKRTPARIDACLQKNLMRMVATRLNSLRSDL